MTLRRSAGALAGALLLAAALPCRAGEAGPSPQDEVLRRLEEQDRRIRDLERRLTESESRAAAAGAPSPAAIDEAVARYLAEDGRAADGSGDRSYLVGSVERPSSDRFHFGGYFSMVYRSPDDPETEPAFDQHRLITQFSFDISPGIEFATEIEYEGGGSGASYLTNNYILVEYAELRFDVAEAFVPRTGIVLVPFLRYNLYHDDPIWNLYDRPFTANRVFRASLQQPGVGAEGVLPLGDAGSLNYNAALTNGPDDGVTNAGWGGARQSFRTDNNDDKAFWARLGAVPRLPLVDAADLGFSWTTGAMDSDGADGSVRMTGWGLDGKVTKDRFDLLFEVARFDYDRPGSQDPADFPRGTNGAFFQLDTRLLRGLPASDNGLVGPTSELILALRWEYADTNDRVTGASPQDDSRALTVGLAFRFTPKTVVRLERKMETTSFREPASADHDQWLLSLSTYF
ncbi:MAG: hypothetical protein HUU06_13280 [Planctomycetaceae bacterium]|nr:hypothetical protein [Planctomycetaceae bacterium]